MTTRQRGTGEPSIEAVRRALNPNPPDLAGRARCIDGREVRIFDWLQYDEGLTVDRVRGDRFDQILIHNATASAALDALAFIVATQGVNRRAGE